MQPQFVVSATLTQSGKLVRGATITSVDAATQTSLILGQLEDDIVSLRPYATMGPYAIFVGYLDDNKSTGDIFYVDAGTSGSLRRITHDANLESPFSTFPFQTAF